MSITMMRELENEVRGCVFGVVYEEGKNKMWALT